MNEQILVGTKDVIVKQKFNNLAEMLCTNAPKVEGYEYVWVNRNAKKCTVDYTYRKKD